MGATIYQYCMNSRPNIYIFFPSYRINNTHEVSLMWFVLYLKIQNESYICDLKKKKSKHSNYYQQFKHLQCCFEDM